MPASSDENYPIAAAVPAAVLREDGVEFGFVGKLQELKYEYRRDITDRAALEKNFREKFEALNRVKLTDSEFARLLDEIVSPDVFAAAKTLREINAFARDDGTPLNYTLVNIRDWCKNTFEVVNQLRINTDNSHHRYDVLLLINGVPCVQIELKTLGMPTTSTGRKSPATPVGWRWPRSRKTTSTSTSPATSALRPPRRRLT